MMLGVIVWVVIFVLALALLVKSADLFLKDTEKISIHFGMSDFLVGISIVALGTSLPELLSSIFAVSQGVTEIVVADVVGSNIANILLVMGFTAFMSRRPIDFMKKRLDIDIILLAVSAFILAITLSDGVFTWYEGILLIIVMCVYIYIMKTKMEEQIVEIEHEVAVQPPQHLPFKVYVSLALACLGLYFGAKYTIDAMLVISRLADITVDQIATSAMAIGTSLPELTVSVIMAARGRAEMVIGNVLGSNIFNTLIVMSIPSLILPLHVTHDTLFFSLPVMVLATVLFLGMLYKKKVERWHGLLMLCCYGAFLLKLFF